MLERHRQEDISAETRQFVSCPRRVSGSLTTGLSAGRDRVILAGFLGLGLKPNKSEERAFEQAQCEQGDIAVLIGDLQFPRMLQAYLKGGLSAVAEVYRENGYQEKKQQFSIGSRGFSAELVRSFFEPQTADERFDKAILEESAGLLTLRQPDFPELMASMRWRSQHPAMVFLRNQFCTAVRDHVIPHIAALRLRNAGIEPGKVRMYSEWHLQSLLRGQSRASKRPVAAAGD